MRKSKELLLIRYIAIFILIFQLFIIGQNKSVLSVVAILLLIINNHLRMFYLKKELTYGLSIILEIIVTPIIQINFGGSIIFYLIGVSIDIFTLKNKKLKYIFAGFTLGISISKSFSSSTEESLIYFVLMGIFFMLLNYISKLYITKKDAQKLYDKLKVSEEKLIYANNELEGYLHSIEEVTLLKERNRISREIHDSVGHALSTAMIQLSAMEAIADKEGSSIKSMANNLRSFINESFQDVKKAVRELKPDEYDNYQGLLRIQEVCKNFEKMTGIEVKTIISKGEWSLSTKQINHVYRITQEVLSNSLRHGKATCIKVIMNFTDDEFVISFNDNGIGVDEIKETGVGLKSIRERTEEINGIVDMKSGKGKGFFIKVIVPKEVEV
ncbi:Oxygen sensor histidine kinase nreB [uncultured Clostridium sp.]|uniref:sensor histidine kinase n=1 Tax=uncultured Clostridium sp. TaxID=59620 RepID=UPI00082186E8|nr:sensor histidine kinase [uncultured Clostridium sp.]SCJ07974.1 Oxygen sensor histidine kinase nreB [uncultured Clostridium sp.]